MLPSGSNLAGIRQGMVEPNDSGAMPNPAPESGMVTGYRSTKTQLNVPKARKRHSTKRPEPKPKSKRMSVKQRNTQIKPPAKPVAKRIRGKQGVSSVPFVHIPGVTEVPL